MRKLIMMLVVSFLLGLIAPQAFAFSPTGTVCSTGSASQASVCQDTSGNTNNLYGPNGVITSVINILSAVVGFIAVFMLVYAGFEYITSGGDSSKTNTAKNTILYAVIGVVVVAIAQLIALFVIDRITP